MKLKIAGYDVEIKGLEEVYKEVILRTGRQIRPEIHINNPTIILPAKEVIKRLLPYLVIIVLFFLVINLLLVGK